MFVGPLFSCFQRKKKKKAFQKTMEEPMQHGQVLEWGRMLFLTPLPAHRSGKAFICLKVPNWIKLD